MEPRARASRHKANLNFGDELTLLLHGTGTPTHPDVTRPLADNSSPRYLTTLPTANKQHPPTPFVATRSVGSGKDATQVQLPTPFPETVRVLDEIVTDYIIEVSHAAASIAGYAGRAKIKREDFEWVMRRDRRKLGRVQEMARRQKSIKAARKPAMGADEGGAMDLRKMQAKDLQDFGDMVGEEGTGKGKGKGRGRRKKKGGLEAEGVDENDMAEMQGVLMRTAGQDGGAGGGGGGIMEDLGDVDADVDDLEEVPEEGLRRKNKRARTDDH